MRPRVSPETQSAERWRLKSPQKRPVSSRPENLRFGGTGWWRRKGPNCQPPTQSSNRSLEPESGTEIFDAETGAQNRPLRLLETDPETLSSVSRIPGVNCGRPFCCARACSLSHLASSGLGALTSHCPDNARVSNGGMVVGEGAPARWHLVGKE